MNVLRLLPILIITLSSLLSPLSSARAAAVDPFPPFSVEGNPPEDYYFSEIFPLFRYIRPRALEIYENADRSREYEQLEMCGYKDADRRDYDCDNQGDGCDGGEVDVCHRPGGGYARTEHSQKGRCKLIRKKDPKYPNEYITGICDYSARPSIARTIKGTDFSTRKDFSDSGLTYPKLQSGSLAYGNMGTDNAITWGSQFLNSNACEIDIRRVLVVRRAKQTKSTVRLTGEWPLGWVDWGYTLKNGKTLLEVNDELPDGVAAPLNGLVEGIDDFYLTAAELDVVTDVSAEKKAICQAVANYRNMSPPPAWIEDLELVPMYPPSYRQGYVRPSICVWDLCRPGTRGDAPPAKGIQRALYYDISISQAYNAALDELFLSYPLDEGLKIFKELITKNPLIRYLTSASEAAIPSAIHTKLTQFTKGTCIDYVPWSTWLGFGNHMDYLKPNNFLGPNDTCPDYILMPEVNKEEAGARQESSLAALINLIWGKAIDEVEPIKYHLLTIPDAMGQSIQEIQQPFYDTRDTLEELESIKEFNLDQSNVVDDNAEYLLGGESSLSADSRRRLGYLSCSDPMFSSQTETSSIEAYALGTRVGCFKTGGVTPGKCDGRKFALIINDSKWQAPLPEATQVIKNSKMFEGGKLNPKLEAAYAAAEEATGVPCEVLAAHHFEEGSSYFTDEGDPTEHSLANGNFLRDEGLTLEESAIATAKQIKTRPYDKNTQSLITAMSDFNGGGNANCQLGFDGGPIPYSGCPRQFRGEDDPYATNLLDSRHQNMYLLFCADFTPCNPPKPYGTDRPGAFPVALVVHDAIKNGTLNAPSTPTSPTSPATGSSGAQSVNPAGTCGDGFVSTGLGCIPYERDAFISALLGFLAGLIGLISLVVMMVGTFMVMTAAGDAEKLKKGKELFTAALTGLLFVIFSVTLLRLIAGDIIKLPGFQGP